MRFFGKKKSQSETSSDIKKETKDGSYNRMEDVEKSIKEGKKPRVPTRKEKRIRRKLDGIRWWMDDCCKVPGTDIRFGIDPLMGLFPVAGDVGSYLVSLYFVYRASPLLSNYTISRMMINCWIDCAIGCIPLVGDIFDFGFKANEKNLAIFDDQLEHGSEDRATKDKLFCCCMLFGLLLLSLGSVAAIIGVIVLICLYLSGNL
mmetsp:Transcript_13760/g.20974  ORF Transcript_13760/g.20974 Transcript_13760/m.20974 type:complete len:203 (+) Transcript_13760:127-735(+)